MKRTTGISWTKKTWNPVHGCSTKSGGYRLPHRCTDPRFSSGVVPDCCRCSETRSSQGIGLARNGTRNGLAGGEGSGEGVRAASV
jgi:hypothetical protein